MPRYLLTEIQELVANGNYLLGTRRCELDTQNLGLTLADVGQLLLNLTPDDFNKEFGCCSTHFGDIITDVYFLSHEGDEYYIKLGLLTSEDGSTCVLVSFHLHR